MYFAIFLNSEFSSLFPESLLPFVKSAAKGHQFSNNDSGVPVGSATATNKFWSPSMFEMYGQSGGDYDG